MKKIIAVLLVVLCAGILTAQNEGGNNVSEQKAGPPKPLSEWTFFQLGFFPGVPGSTDYSNVYGMKLGAPMVSGYGRVYGIEPSIFYSGTDYVKGIQASWFGPAIGKNIEGLHASCVTCIADEVTGIEGSVVNVTDNFVGLQAGAVNVTKDSTGLQLGAVNYSKYTAGLQFGAINYSCEGSCQLGFINIIEDGLLPFMILFNVSF